MTANAIFVFPFDPIAKEKNIYTVSDSVEIYYSSQKREQCQIW